jgi:hypothetical protein
MSIGKLVGKWMVLILVINFLQINLTKANVCSEGTG